MNADAAPGKDGDRRATPTTATIAEQRPKVRAVPGASRPVLQRALELATDGLHVIGTKLDKLPVGATWKEFQTVAPSTADLYAMAEDPRCVGFAVLCGAGRPVLCLDVEKAGVDDSRLRELLDLLPTSCRVSTPSGGEHAWFEVTEGDVPSGTKLAYHLNGAGSVLLAETRGVGQYAVILGPGRELPDDFEPKQVTRTQLDKVLAVIAAMSELEPTPPKRERAPLLEPYWRGDSPTADALADLLMDDAITWANVLDRGWTMVGYDHDGRSHWLRPDYGQPPTSADSGNGAERMRDGPKPTFIVHSSSVPWANTGVGYTPAQALAAARSGGDMAAALRGVDEAAAGRVPKALADWPPAALDRLTALLGNRTVKTEPVKEPAGRRTLASQILTVRGLKTLPKQSPLIDGVLMDRSMHLLSGRKATLKSLLVVDWGLCLATGKDWQGLAVARRPVLYVVGEGAFGLDARVTAWQHAWGTEVDEDAFHVLPVGVNLFRGGADAGELVVDLAPSFGLVVVDTLRRSSGGADGNSDKDMGIVIDQLECIKRAAGSTLLVAHSQKEDTDTRGSSVLEDDHDVVWHTKAEDAHIRLVNTKMKDGPDGAEFRLHSRQVLDSLIIENHNRGDEVAPAKESEAELLAVMVEHFTGLAPPTGPEVRSVFHQVTGKSDATCKRALSALIATGKVALTGTRARPTYTLTAGSSEGSK